jgi:hypothetical protein
MTNPTAATSERPGNMGRSIGAVVAGFVAVFIVTTIVDVVLHALHVYPPWGQPMFEAGLNALALSYRIVITIAGAYLTAKLAPRNPMRHTLVLGVIGTLAAIVGAALFIPKHMGPNWYPIAIAVTGLPCCWLGGLLYQARHGEGSSL